MAVPRDQTELIKRNTTITCPHCGDRVKLLAFSNLLNAGHYTYFVALCPNTDKLDCDPVFCIYEDMDDKIIQCYPAPGADADKYHQATPPNIREDFAEAIRCFYSKSYKGCVVMCRRVVDAIACDTLGAEAKRDNGQTRRLTKLIEMMLEKGLITNAIKETADEIRFFGDYGAHSQDDGLDAVSEDDAETIRQLTDELIKAVYTTPYETQKLRKKREGQ